MSEKNTGATSRNESEERIVRYTLEELEKLPGQTDWARLDALTDEEIERAIAEDPDAALPLGEDFFRNAELVMPAGSKERITMYVDQDVLEYFRAGGKGYQTRMNAVLRAYVHSRRVRRARRRSASEKGRE